LVDENGNQIEQQFMDLGKCIYFMAMVLFALNHENLRQDSDQPMVLKSCFF